jgi:renalase
MRVVVIGAGLAGLTAATQLSRHHEVVVLERSPTVGGRLCTTHVETRLGHASFDVGAQFFSVRGTQLEAQTDEWMRAGVVREWCRGFTDPPDGHPRYVGVAGMDSIAAELARGLDVRTDSYVFTLRQGTLGWRVVLVDATIVEADCLVLACPVPQSRALLIQSDVELPEALTAIEYERTIALLVALDGPSAVPDPGGVQLVGGEVFGFVADNHRKGVSAVTALTCHAGAAWSDEHWDRPTTELVERLIAAAGPFIGNATAVHTGVRRWRLATPRPTWPEACWSDPDRRVVLAGDAFAGPKFEGAYLSGLAAADRLHQLLR